MIAVAVLDQGFSNTFNDVVRRSVYERDFLFSDNETDTGVVRTHGTIVAEAILGTNGRLDLIDAAIGTTTIASWTVESALRAMIGLADQGYQIGSINCSFSSGSLLFPAPFQDEIDVLASRGIFVVAATGNSGILSTLERPDYPAAQANVIAVGSHDGYGFPSYFSQQGLDRVIVLADGEGHPSSEDLGTSFSAPQVAATVATVQGLAHAATGRALSFQQMVDVLQQGGNGPRSAPDPADGATLYVLHDHAGSIQYALRTHVEPLEYLASNADLRALFGADRAAATAHLLTFGIYEGRPGGFDSLAYLASHADLRAAFGIDRAAAALHYVTYGADEGRTITFDARAYLEANPDVAAAVQGNLRSAAAHHLMFGAGENRPLRTVATSELDWIDFDNSVHTAGVAAIGAVSTGGISSPLDSDWYRLTLLAGDRVVIEVKGSDSLSGTLSDPFLGLRDSSGRLLSLDFDSGVGRDARLTYTALSSGAHFVEASNSFGPDIGTYQLSVARANGFPSSAAGPEGEVEAIGIPAVSVGDTVLLAL